MDDLASALRLVSGIGGSAASAQSGWESLIGALATHCVPATVSQLRRIDIESDVASVGQQLAEIFRQDPPPDDIDAFWFGLFDGFDEDGSERIGYYVAGVRGFDPDDEDSVCFPAWSPDEGYLASSALAAIKEAELDASRRDADDERDWIGYAGQLGAALLVSRFAAAELAGERQLVVGFDSGDRVVVGA